MRTIETSGIAGDGWGDLDLRGAVPAVLTVWLLVTAACTVLL